MLFLVADIVWLQNTCTLLISDGDAILSKKGQRADGFLCIISDRYVTIVQAGIAFISWADGIV